MPSTTNWTFALAKGSSQCLVEHSIVDERTLSRRLCRIWSGGGWFLTGNYCHVIFLQKIPPCHAIPGFCRRSPSTEGSPSCFLLDPRHSTNAMAPFSRTPLNLTIPLFIVVLFGFWRCYRSFFPRWRWRARGSFDWTRCIFPTHIPRMLWLIWLSSFPFSDWVSNGSSHCSRCLTPPSHCPPPLSCPLLPAPLPLLLPLRPLEPLPLSLEGPLPPPGLPTNCSLHLLFSFS